MRSKKWCRMLQVGLMAGCLLVQPMMAGNAHAAATEDMWTKLGRGFTNMATGWIEIFAQPQKMAEEKSWGIALLGGIPKGIGYFYMRTLVGVYETVTFFAPIPEGYRVIMEPEYIIPN